MSELGSIRRPPATSDTDSGGAARSPRRALLWGAGIAALVGACLVADLPRHTTHAGQVSAAVSVVNQINSDVAPCAYAVKEAVAIESALSSGTMSRPDRARIPGLLRDDQNACAFTNSSINDLANLEVPGTAAGTHLADAVSSATMWASSDALAAVEAVQRLTSNPLDRTARDQMVTSERIMGTERATVEGHLKAAEGILGTPLPALVLPVIAVSR